MFSLFISALIDAQGHMSNMVDSEGKGIDASLAKRGRRGVRPSAWRVGTMAVGEGGGGG